MTQSETGSDPRGARRKLPIGIQTFREIREEGCYYVDKTAYVQRLVDEGKHYFLSRPRRFGKSLLVDTIKELFEGNEPLFRGLAIHERWDWSAPRPVLRLDFGDGGYGEPGLVHEEAAARLGALERRFAVTPHDDIAPARFRHLLQTLHERTGRRVAVLIDEYDKPILDALRTPETARANRDFLHGLYSVIKSADAHVEFTLLTGVSKFSKVSLFSGLNNLKDITLDPRYSAICGYTEADLDTVFAPELPGLDRGEIRRWYNGYGWLGDDALLSAFDVGAIATEALLFQTGYLTIHDERDVGGEAAYRLGYPNREVRQSLNRSLLSRLADDPSGPTGHRVRLYDLLRDNDFDGMEALLRAFFAGIPYQWHTKNDIADYEGYYASVFYALFASAGLDMTVEDSSSRGRVDLTVRLDGSVYLFEFKVVDPAPPGSSAPQSAAMTQLRERGYADKHRSSGRPIHLIAVEFSKETRNLAVFEAAPA